ncbi:MAG: alkaline phosphatase family protein, partial [Acidobacteriota bacterium]|nr:alkaline phosphatase family protein [Acidobacteriota bacterium]
MAQLRFAARSAVSTLLALLLLVSASFVSNAQTQRRTGQTSVPREQPALYARPRLVLLIAVDQFRADYLERFGDLFSRNGLGRLMREGAMWTDANFDHMPTETAPGHATLLTGAWPSESGIIGNQWFEREAGKNVENTLDESVKILGGAGDERGKSPRRLLASTLGDELRLRSNGRAKVIGISAKDRGAIMPAGRNASAAYWFSATTGRLISSTYYFNQLPAWVQQFNETNPSDKFFNAQWERLLKDAGEYERRAGPDAPEWENLLGERERQRERERGLDTAFPHLIKGKESKPGADFYDVLTASPFSNDLLVEFAKLAITNEALGADADTDVLTVGFSANDYVGHR